MQRLETGDKAMLRLETGGKVMQRLETGGKAMQRLETGGNIKSGGKSCRGREKSHGEDGIERKSSRV